MLLLSLFPGVDLLGHAFEQEWPDACIVRGPDPIFGSLSDIRAFHPPAGVFAGVCGGPPCQEFSALVHLVRADGNQPRFGNLIPEFERCVAEAQPDWFLMENVRAAPVPVVAGYGVRSFLLDNSTLNSGDGWGQEQIRLRRFSFGMRGVAEPPCLLRWIDVATLLLPDATGTNTQCDRRDNSAEAKTRHETLTGGHDKPPSARKAAVTSSDGGPTVRMRRYRLADALRLQGLPDMSNFATILVCQTQEKSARVAEARKIASATSAWNALSQNAGTRSPDCVWYADADFPPGLQSDSRRAVVSVRIDSALKNLEIRSGLDGSVLLAAIAVRSVSWHRHEQGEARDFAQALALMRTRLEQTAQIGREASRQSTLSTRQTNGIVFAAVSGEETSELAVDADRRMSLMSRSLSSITSGPCVNFLTSNSILETLCSCVASVTASCIRGQIPDTSSFILNLRFERDFLADCPMTAEGKLKAVANGVCLFTGRAIARAIREALLTGAYGVRIVSP